MKLVGPAAFSLLWTMARSHALSMAASFLAPPGGDSCSCNDCHALLRRSLGQEKLGLVALGTGAVAVADQLDQHLQCFERQESLMHCHKFCETSCRPFPSSASAAETPCADRGPHVPELSLAQVSVALQLLACPEPKPCSCNCFCDPIMYGTPVPMPPTPFATASPPPLSLLESKKLAAAAQRSMGFAAEEDFPVRVQLGWPLPLPPPPPPPDRSFCPKAAACNCFCPCRD